MRNLNCDGYDGGRTKFQCVMHWWFYTWAKFRKTMLQQYPEESPQISTKNRGRYPKTEHGENK